MRPPDQVCLVLTTKCNLRCINCRSWEFQHREELDAEQTAGVLDALCSWLGPSEVDGAPRHAWEIYLAGGEPFVRKDIIGLLEQCRDLGIWAQVTTNGTPW